MKILAALLLVALLLIVWWLKLASTRPRKVTVKWVEPEDGFPATGVEDPRLRWLLSGIGDHDWAAEQAA